MSNKPGIDGYFLKGFSFNPEKKDHKEMLHSMIELNRIRNDIENEKKNKTKTKKRNLTENKKNSKTKTRKINNTENKKIYQELAKEISNEQTKFNENEKPVINNDNILYNSVLYHPEVMKSKNYDELVKKNTFRPFGGKTKKNNKKSRKVHNKKGGISKKESERKKKMQDAKHAVATHIAQIIGEQPVAVLASREPIIVNAIDDNVYEYLQNEDRRENRGRRLSSPTITDRYEINTYDSDNDEDSIRDERLLNIRRSSHPINRQLFYDEIANGGKK
jgi:hypothetical protein